MRRAAKVDANQPEIVDGLRRCGFGVLDLSAVGGGCPDLLVCAWRRNVLLEIKDGSKPPSARKLTPAQRRFFSSWSGPVHVVTSFEEALEVLRVDS